MMHERRGKEWLPSLYVCAFGLVFEEAIYDLNSLREGVILIRDLVTPSAKTAAAINIQVLELLLYVIEQSVPPGKWNGISMVEFRREERYHLRGWRQ